LPGAGRAQSLQNEQRLSGVLHAERHVLDLRRGAIEAVGAEIGDGHAFFVVVIEALDGLTRCLGSEPGSTKITQQGRPIDTTELKEQEWIAVQRVREGIVDSCDVLTGLGLIGTCAVSDHFGVADREQVHVLEAKDLFDIPWHVSTEEICSPVSLTGQPSTHPFPVSIAERVHINGRGIGLGTRTLYFGGNPARRDREGDDVPLVSIVFAAG